METNLDCSSERQLNGDDDKDFAALVVDDGDMI